MRAAVQQQKRGFLTHSSGWHCETVPSSLVRGGSQQRESPRPAAAAWVGLRASVSPHSLHPGSGLQLPITDLRLLLLSGAVLLMGGMFGPGQEAGRAGQLQGWLSRCHGASAASSRCDRHGQAHLSTAPRCFFLGSHEKDVAVDSNLEWGLASTHHWTPAPVIQEKLESRATTVGLLPSRASQKSRGLRYLVCISQSSDLQCRTRPGSPSAEGRARSCSHQSCSDSGAPQPLCS